jgi:hypothetical protein
VIRPSTYDLWSNERLGDGERLAAFESWLWHELQTRLKWPRDEAAAAKQIGQCRAFVLQAVGDLGRHGFLFRSPDLRSMICEKLDDLAARQLAGEITDLWPYFRATWTRWVRLESDTLKDRAMSVGVHITQAQERALRLGTPSTLSMPQLVEQSLREQAAAARRKQRQMPDADTTPELPLLGP